MFESRLLENFADLDRTFAAFDMLRRATDSSAHAGFTVGSQREIFTVEDRGDAFVLEAELPGVPADRLELTLTGPVLKLRARRQVETPAGFVAHRRERPSLDLTRSITLPARVDAERVTAEAKDGIVTVTLPKAAEAKPRNIQVRSV